MITIVTGFSMILTCPECSARYIVDPLALLPKGRMVRCAKCRHSWREAAPDSGLPADANAANPPKEKVAGLSPPETEAAADTNDDFAIQRARRQKRLRPVPKGSNLPALQNHKHSGGLWGWYALGTFIAIIIGSFLFFQNNISEFWPPSQKLYRSLGMAHDASGSSEHAPKQQQHEIPFEDLFEIKDTTPNKILINGVTTLKVEGNIINLSGKTLPLPLLEISLKNDQGGTVRKWTFTPSATTISPKGKVAFSTSLPNPPNDATSISVIFVKK